MFVSLASNFSIMQLFLSSCGLEICFCPKIWSTIIVLLTYDSHAYISFKVWCYNGEQLIQRKVLKLGPNVTEVSLPLQLDYPQLRIQVAAMAGNVVGLPSNPVQIKFTSVEDSESEPIGGIFREMWVLIVAGVVVWLLLFIICVIIIKRYVSEKMSASGTWNIDHCFRFVNLNLTFEISRSARSKRTAMCFEQ